MPGGKYAKANRRRKEEQGAKDPERASPAPNRSTRRVDKKKGQVVKKDPWAAALAKARTAAASGADLAAVQAPAPAAAPALVGAQGAQEAMRDGLDLTPVWMRGRDQADVSDDGISLRAPKPLSAKTKILPAHARASSTKTSGEGSWAGGDWTWLAQGGGARQPTLMERLAELPENLPGGPVPDYYSHAGRPCFPGEETNQDLRDRFRKDPTDKVPLPPPPPRVLQKPPKPTPPPKLSPPPKPTPKPTPKPSLISRMSSSVFGSKKKKKDDLVEKIEQMLTDDDEAAPPPKPSPSPKPLLPAQLLRPPVRQAPRPAPVPIRQGNPVLVLADMNGTLLHRSKTKLSCRAQPVCEANKTFYYARPGAKDLLAFLLHAARTTEEGRRRVVFAFYTSMREENARPIADYLTGGRRVDIYERKFNKPDPSGSESWDTMRDLPMVWGAVKPSSARGFTAENTVVIDDTLRKMRELPHNVMVVPPFEEPAVRKDDDEALDYVKAYLDMLLDEEDDTVPATLKARPFRAGFL